MGRIGRSFQLVGQSYRILMQDKGLMVLPLISGTFIAAAMVALGFGFGIDTAHIERHGADTYLPLFLMYVVSYAIGIFFQAAVVAGATERMRGGDPTIGSALGAAGRRIGPILMWAVVAATVGVALRAIQEPDRRRLVARHLLHRPRAGAGRGIDAGLVPALARSVPEDMGGNGGGGHDAWRRRCVRVGDAGCDHRPAVDGHRRGGRGGVRRRRHLPDDLLLGAAGCLRRVALSIRHRRRRHAGPRPGAHDPRVRPQAASAQINMNG